MQGRVCDHTHERVTFCNTADSMHGIITPRARARAKVIGLCGLFVVVVLFIIILAPEGVHKRDSRHPSPQKSPVWEI